MYKINYERLVTALWDPDLKEKLFELFFLHFPDTSGMPAVPRLREAKILGGCIVSTREMLEAMAKHLLELEYPDPHELKAFINRNSGIMGAQITKILDMDELIEESKKRGLIR